MCIRTFARRKAAAAYAYVYFEINNFVRIVAKCIENVDSRLRMQRFVDRYENYCENYSLGVGT